MKKRKIRYDRILLPILILCVIILEYLHVIKQKKQKFNQNPFILQLIFKERVKTRWSNPVYLWWSWNEAQTGSRN